MDTSEYDKNLSDASNQTQSFADKLKGGFGTAAKIGAAAIAAGGAAVVGFGKSAVDAGRTFDASMSQVAATMGTTVDQIGELRDFAQEMGATTAFSASQAADALNYMALAGYDSSQAMEALPNVLNLAAAGGIELAQASDMVTDAQSALGLTMDQSAELVDKIAQASSKSNTSVAQLGDAILTVGGTAKNLAGGTTELSTALGILADNGVKGAEGGTALRNIILSLSAPTDNAALALKKLGVEVFDAEGNMRPLNETFADMGAALGSLSGEEKINALNNIFNKVDLKSVNALLDNTTDEFAQLYSALDDYSVLEEKVNGMADPFGALGISVEALREALVSVSSEEEFAAQMLDQYGMSAEQAKFVWEEMSEVAKTSSSRFDELAGYIDDATGAAQAMADTQLDNLEGDITLFKSALEGIQIAISDRVTPALREFVQFGSDGLSRLTEALQEGGLDGALDVFGDILDEGIGKIFEALPKVLEVGGRIVLSLAAGIVKNLPKLGQALLDGIPTLMTAAQTAFSSLMETLQTRGPEMLSRGRELIGRLGEGISNGASTAISTVGSVLSTIVRTVLDHGPEIIKQGGILLLNLAQGLLSKLPEVAGSAAKVIGSLVGGLVKNAPKIIATGLELIGRLAVGIIKGIPKLLAAIPEIIKGFISGFLGGEWSGAGSDVIGKIVDGIKAALAGIGEIFAAGFTLAKDAIFGVFSGIGGWFSGKFAEAKETAASAFSGIRDRMSESWSGIKAVFSSTGGWFADKFAEAKEKAGASWEGIKEWMSNSWTGIKASFAAMGDWFGEKFGAAKESAASAWEGIRGRMSGSWESVKGVFATVGDWFGEKFGDAKERASTAFSGIRERMSGHWENVKGVFAGTGEWFRARFAEAKERSVSAWSDIKSRFAEIKDRIKSGLNLGEAFTWGKDMLQNFINGITAKWDALKNTVSSLAGTVKDFLGFSEPKKGPLSNFHTYAPDMIALFIKGIRDNQPKLWRQIERTFGFDLFGNTFGQLRGGGGGQKSALDKFTELYNKLDNYEILEKKVNGIADPFGAIGLSITELVDTLNASASQEEFSARMMREYSPKYEEYSKFIWDEMADAAREVALASSTAAAAQEKGGESITINVYPSAGMDEERLADLIDRKLAERYNRRRAVFG